MSTIPAWARKGAEVICIRDFATSQTVRDKGIRLRPELHKSYVVTDVEVWPEYAATVLCLAGFPGQAFDIRGFAPAAKRTAEQDIAEHFSHHLTAPEGVPA